MDEQDRRLYLQSLLAAIPGVRKVYHQPPANVKMEYPCIRYKMDVLKPIHANDQLYNYRKGWIITIIDSNPDSTIPVIFFKNFPYAKFERNYTEDNMNHWTYLLYF